MQFQSTRDPNTIVSSSEAILRGLAPDGGLFVPTAFPKAELEDWKSLSYPELAQKVLAGFLTDYDPAFLGEAAAATYGDAFAGKAGYVQKVHDGLYSLELWHGPTCAFKDYALQLMPKLLVQAKKNLGRTETTRILVATSGDTGKAALEGYRDVDRIRIAVFYPENGVSTVQKLQMQTQTGKNVNVTAIRGNFDDAQNGVKEIFADREFAKELNKRGLILSSANSINWGRLAPQIVYYVSAYCDLLNRDVLRFGERMNICVPTGNFGDILAGYYAKLLGLPVKHLVVASDKNNVLFDFLTSGTYNRQRPFFQTISPSMDILISSNLERMLYYMSDKDTRLISMLMNDLNKWGTYEIPEELLAKIRQIFGTGWADENQVREMIADCWNKNHYVIDPHTACGYYLLEQMPRDPLTPRVLLSTASPYKFPRVVNEALGFDATGTDFECMDVLAHETGTTAPAALRGLETADVRFKDVVAIDGMEDYVEKAAQAL